MSTHATTDTDSPKPYATFRAFLGLGLLTILFLSFGGSSLYSQSCPNVDFSMGNFTGWQGRTGTCCPILLPTPGFVAGRHTIINTPGIDGNTCGGLVLPAPGFTAVARLGNPVNGAQAEGLSYTLTVDPTNALFIYTFAVVLEDPGHTVVEQPRFELQVRDQFNNIIPCTFYEVAAGAGIPGFNTCGGVVWKDWTTAGVDLSAYMGQTVTIEARTGDCDLGGHYGYAYLVGQCQPLQINVAYCSGSPSATLTAPAGFTYLWSTGQTTQTVVIPNPPPSVTCTLTSVTGCQAVLTANITPLTVTGNITASNNVSCFGGNNGSATVTASGGTGPYTYAWAPSGGTAATATNLIAGTYTVTITESSNNCTGTATVTITQPLAPIALTSTSTNVSCFGGNNGSVDLTVNGGTPGYNYNWSTGSGAQDIIGLTAGTYTVTVTDANGCTATHSRIVTQPAAPLNVTGVTTNILCNGGSTGAINITVTGGTPTYSFNWSTGSGSEDITGLIAGTYTVSVMDANGCVNNSYSATLTQPAAALSVTGTSTNVTCFGINNGSINITPNGGTAPYTYLWTNGATTQDLTNIGPGSYGVVITDANGCTNNSFTANISQPAAGLSVTGVTTNVGCFGGNNGAVDITVNGGTPGYNYNWSTGSGTQDINNLIAGNYNVTVTDFNGCTITYSTTVTQPASALAITGTGTNVSCNGGTNGAVNINVTGGTSPYNFNWSTGAGTEDVTGLSSGTYSVIVTDANGCTNTFSTTLTQPAFALNITGTSNNISCFNGSNGAIDITPTGGTPGYSYQWNNGATTQDITGLIASPYSVVVTDANGCTSSYGVTLTMPATAISITGVTTNVNCFGGNTGSIDITPTGGTTPYSYNWTTGAGTQDITNLVAGGYTVTLTDFAGCSATYSNTITQPFDAVIVTPSSTNVSCLGGSNGSINIIPSGGIPGYTFNWSTGATTQNLSGLAPGTYSVIVTDATGCTTTYSNTITQPATAVSVAGNTININCFSGNTGAIDITPSGGTPGYTYGWSTGSGTQDLSGLIAGTYSVVVTDANGCTNTFSTTVTQPASALAVTGTQINILCFGAATGSIDITPSGGTTPYAYSWSNGSGAQDISGLAAGPYMVTVSDANGCTNTSFSAILTQPASAISVSGAVTNVLCFEDNTGAINITTSGGTPGYTFIWSTGAVTEDLNNLTAGPYALTVTDANGCTNTSFSTMVTQPAAPLTVTGTVTHVLCTGSTTGSINITPSGGTAPYTFIWNNGSITEDQTGLATGFYAVTVTDANGCINSNYSVNINQPSSVLSVTGIPINPACNGTATGSINSTASGGTPPYAYAWSNGMDSEDITNLNGGTYSLVVTDGNGCMANDSWTLTDPLSLSMEPVITSPSCFGIQDASIQLLISGGTPGYNVVWNTGATGATINNLNPGTFTATVTDSRGCIITDAYVIAPTPPIAFGLDTMYLIWLGGDVQLNAYATGGTSPFTYSWSPPDDLTCSDCPDPVASPTSNTTYGITVTDANGCVATGSVDIEIMYALYVPNTFTPNGDGTNDEFNAVSGSIKQFSMRIFDRWGEEVFTTSNIHKGWDGFYKGLEAKQDVYVYRIEATFMNGKYEELIGQVNLIR